METPIIEGGQIIVPAPIRKRYRLSKRSAKPFRVVLLELFSPACRERGEDVAAVRYTIFKQSGIRILWEVDGPPLLAARRIKARYRLSTADAIFAACALREKCIKRLGTRAAILSYRRSGNFPYHDKSFHQH